MRTLSRRMGIAVSRASAFAGSASAKRRRECVRGTSCITGRVVRLSLAGSSQAGLQRGTASRAGAFAGLFHAHQTELQSSARRERVKDFILEHVTN